MNATPEFPKPDRSKFQPNFVRSDDGPVLDIGWQEGVLPDGRPFRAEAWALDGITMLTFFVPAEGIDLSDKEAAARYVEAAGLVRFRSGHRGCEAMKHRDDSGNEMWSINLAVGLDDAIYLEEDNTLLRAYEQRHQREGTRPRADEPPNPTNATSKEGDANE